MDPETAIVASLASGAPRGLQAARDLLVQHAGQLDLRRLWSLAEQHGVRAALAEAIRRAADVEPDLDDAEEAEDA